MRKVTNEAVNAFINARPFKNSNTKVEIRNGETFLYLHNNMIAHKGNNQLFITTCGWESNTTKERLNGILDAFNLPRISQKNFVWFIGSEELNGKKVFNL